MTATELNALSADAADETNRITAITEQVLLRGIVAAAEAFNYDAPLPDHRIRQARSWEPAARRFRDLTDEERGEQR